MKRHEWTSGEDELYFLDIALQFTLVSNLHNALLKVSLLSICPRELSILTRTAVWIFLTRFAHAAMSLHSSLYLFQVNCSPFESRLRHLSSDAVLLALLHRSVILVNKQAI
jgi:hypothetical protein